MATYRYTAKNAHGDVAVGSIEALSPEEAVEVLLGRDLVDIQILVIDKADVKPAPSRPLSSDEASELTHHVAQLSSANIPLAPGLRAAADESSSARVASALRWMADQIEKGRSLEDVLTQSGPLLPRHISGLVLAAARTGTLGESLFELVEHQQTTRSLRQEISTGFVYPLFVVAIATVVLLGTTYYVTGLIEQMFEEFQMNLPLVSRALFWWRDTGLPWMGGILLTVLVLTTFFRLVAGRVRWWKLVGTIPLIGPLWRWSGVAEWASLMAVLLKHQLRLPDALRLAGYGTRNEHVGHLSLQLADGVARGRNLADLMRANCQIPATLVPLVDWGERSAMFAESFRAGSVMFQKRVQTRALLVFTIVPPLLFLGIGCCVLFVVFGSFGPLIDLIEALS